MNWMLLLILVMAAAAVSIGFASQRILAWAWSWVVYAGQWTRWLISDLQYWRTWPLNGMREKEKRK